MNITLTVVVAAIVILITALVVITIFGSGMTNVGSMAELESFCKTQCETSCRTTGQPPVTWNVNNVQDKNGQLTSCGAALGIRDFQCNNNKCPTDVTGAHVS